MHNYHVSNQLEESKVNKQNRLRLLFVLILTFSFMIVEFIGGYLSNSLALISDAAHMLTDSIALFITLTSFYISLKPANPKNSYGWSRAEILAGFINGIFLIFLCGAIVLSAIERMISPPVVKGDQMMLIAVIGLIVNLINAALLAKSKSKSLVLKSALIHILGDALASVSAIVAAFFVINFQAYFVDPLLSFLVASIIFYNALKLIFHSGKIILQSVPDYIDLNELVYDLKQIDGVDEVHDCHVWSLKENTTIVTVHFVTECPSNKILMSAKEILAEKYQISHSTIQMEPKDFELALFNKDGKPTKHLS